MVPTMPSHQQPIWWCSGRKACRSRRPPGPATPVHERQLVVRVVLRWRLRAVHARMRPCQQVLQHGSTPRPRRGRQRRAQLLLALWLLRRAAQDATGCCPWVVVVVYNQLEISICR